jgi:hypothetical protein
LTSTAYTRKLLFIVGMHRSGTSALCAALAACGVSFGNQLLDALAGVNEEGFWEDAGLVEINEHLLALADSSWYAPVSAIAEVDWASEKYDSLRDQGRELLRSGFGEAQTQAVKDPRFCLTLPFWLSLCDELGTPARVCVITRAPLEVARSLQQRDGFPLGYGLRLFALYRHCIDRFVPADALYVRYDDLLRDAQSVVATLSELLPLASGSGAGEAVRGDLRHQLAGEGSALLTTADSGVVDLAALEKEIEENYPLDETVLALADALANRGQELARIGREHAGALATLDQRDNDIEALSAEHRIALATIDERDADIESLSAQHRAALATIDERDEQIREFDRRLSQLGEEHSHALQTLRERDAELAWIKQRLDVVSKVPGVGYLIRRMRKHAQG